MPRALFLPLLLVLSICPTFSSSKPILLDSSTVSEVHLDVNQYEHNVLNLKKILPNQRWSLILMAKMRAYGLGATFIGPVAAKYGGVGVVFNNEAEIAFKHRASVIVRMMPPDNVEQVLGGIQYGVHEMVHNTSDLNIIYEAAKRNRTVINIHLYMYEHYDQFQGYVPQSISDLRHIVDSLDARYVRLVGLMMHMGDVSEEQKAPRLEKFLKLTCPIAARLPHKAWVHWAASSELHRLVSYSSPPYLLQPPLMPPSCSAPNINFWLRVGRAAMGLYPYFKHLPPAAAAITRSLFRPILFWSSHISRLRHESGKLLAEIPIGFKDGYPMLFVPHAPLPHVEIAGEKFPMVAPPTEHKMVVDVTGQEGEWMRVGEKVWLLGEKVNLADWFSGLFDVDAAFDIISCIAMGASSFVKKIDASYCHKFVAI
eukprot:TRINITY_DN3308_c0_g1_i3.p1 TRINITY_DN3308_c0_g1~~TRINITY_DN3308_c0_g1_i3.p1  ORF type:complete len:426 (+),score=84.95 TRINITY_DN3308_c0_g1_i3:140-1417(+)